MTKANMIWQTDEDPEKMGEYEIARNIEVRDHEDGNIEIRVIQQTLRTDAVSLPKILSPIEAINLGVALINAARIDLGAHR